jgi:hypothetical protein
LKLLAQLLLLSNFCVILGKGPVTRVVAGLFLRGRPITLVAGKIVSFHLSTRENAVFLIIRSFSSALVDYTYYFKKIKQ